MTCIKTNAERQRSNIPLLGIGAASSTKTKGVVEIPIKPHFKSQFELVILVHALPELTTSLFQLKTSSSNTYVTILQL